MIAVFFRIVSTSGWKKTVVANTLQVTLHRLRYLVSYAEQCHLSYFEVYPRLHSRSTTSSLVSPRDIWRSSALTNIILTWICLIILCSACLYCTTIYKLTKSVHKMTLGISMFKKFTFFVNTKMLTRDTCHLYAHPFAHQKQNYHPNVLH